MKNRYIPFFVGLFFIVYSPLVKAMDFTNFNSHNNKDFPSAMPDLKTNSMSPVHNAEKTKKKTKNSNKLKSRNGTEKETNLQIFLAAKKIKNERAIVIPTPTSELVSLNSSLSPTPILGPESDNVLSLDELNNRFNEMQIASLRLGQKEIEKHFGNIQRKLDNINNLLCTLCNNERYIIHNHYNKRKQIKHTILLMDKYFFTMLSIGIIGGMVFAIIFWINGKKRKNGDVL